MERLFKSFSQIDASTTRRYGGTGLGLAISKQIVDLMGGEIGVESELGRGSTFWFTVVLEPVNCVPSLPRRNAARRRQGFGAASVPSYPGDSAAGTDSEPGMLAKSAGSRDEAEKLLTQPEGMTPFDVVLIDRNISEMETLSFPESSKRLLLTSAAEDLPVHRLKSLGFAGSVIKPIRTAALIEKIVAARSLELPEQPERAVQSPAQPSQVIDKPRRILLAEDNPINQIVASELLTRAGYHVSTVADGHAAVQAFCEGAYDLVLMDCQMPVMDGLEATRAIRQAEAAQGGNSERRVPIVALTANASNVDRERCIGAGMDGYFQKPFKPRDLLETVERHLSAAKPLQTPNSSVKPQPTISSNESAKGHLDKNTLLESCSGNTELAGSILLRFEKQINNALSEFARFVDEQDAAALARLAHTLKGTAGSIGAALASGF